MELSVLSRMHVCVHALDHMPDEQEMLHLAERWRPYRTLAVGYLFASLFDETNRATGTVRSR